MVDKGVFSVSKNKDGEKVYHIEYNGKSFDTLFYKKLSDSEYMEVVNYFRTKPDFGLVKRQLFDLFYGSKTINYVDKYYFRDIWSKVCLYHSIWSIEEVLDCKYLVEVYAAKVSENKDVFPDTMSLSQKIGTAFRIGGSGICRKPSNFPYSEIDSILEKYNVNNNYYDFSCGWGVRLLCSMVRNVNYYGTDPNYLLVERLNQLIHDFKDIFISRSSVAKIYCQGSETLIPELVGKIGLAFSSPPYFNLEDYRVGDKQSYKAGITSYKSWLENYYIPTMKNIYQYLIPEGYFMLNIKDFGKYKLEEHTVKLAEYYCKFKHVDTIKLKNIVRNVMDSDGGSKAIDNTENIFVFKKK